jgi:hypothetical protein
MLSYTWLCPEDLESLCEGQKKKTFYIPWSQLHFFNLTFAEPYLFGVRVGWLKQDGRVESREEYV